MSPSPADTASHRLTAVLGPTNTGKTHLAVERMLGYATGMIGLPLRLLAREIYDRVASLRGPRQVALITGEERILPPRPNYFVCTVESMPTDRAVDFVAIDEVQLAADLERGHVFTDRLLHARGGRETWFLGAETMQPVLKKLLPGLRFVSRPRFSDLSYAGHKKLTRLPRRSAIVAFSASEVYAVAELIRRQRGGAAVIMGALSPRTRNAQVALYQSGEVDFLVATDAIGMGLNMNVDHVAFAADRKFDGISNRVLKPAEIGQIAGRAGRYMNNGSFGVTASTAPFDGDIVEMVENHRFDPIEHLQWRNSRLDFSSLHGLRHSLKRRPNHRNLVMARDADDVRAFHDLTQDPEIVERVSHPAAAQRLWDVCRVPDFRKTMADNHHRLLKDLYCHLMSENGVIPEDWLAPLVDRLDSTVGDIDALSHRIAHVRTWTYVANRSDWLDDPGHWRARTRELEDRLSDALHANLTQRFVDRRTAALYRSLKSKRDLFGAVTADGDVLVEGQFVGKLKGLTFTPDAAANTSDSQAIRAAANRVLRRELDKIAAQLVNASDDEISWRDDNRLWWRGAQVARLRHSDNPRRPRLQVLETDHLSGSWREQVRRRLAGWLERHVDASLQPVLNLQDLDLKAAGKGLAFQLNEAMGSLPRKKVGELLATLDKGDKKRLSKAGVKFGYVDIFMPTLLRPDKAQVKARLWRARHASGDEQVAPQPGLVSFAVEPAMSADFLDQCGFRVFRDRAIRIDMLDRLAALAHKAGENGPFAINHAMVSLAGCNERELAGVLRGLGYRAKEVDGILTFRYRHRARQPKRRRATETHSPFASLEQWRAKKS